jgi:DNA-binding transcriptional MerR regulator
VLRYWETEFKQLNPNKNKAGNRTYRQKDIDLILDIKNLLYSEKFTIVGARKMLIRPTTTAKTAIATKKKVFTNSVDKKTLVKIRSDLKSILDDVQN